MCSGIDSNVATPQIQVQTRKRFSLRNHERHIPIRKTVYFSYEQNHVWDINVK